MIYFSAIEIKYIRGMCITCNFLMFNLNANILLYVRNCSFKKSNQKTIFFSIPRIPTWEMSIITMKPKLLDESSRMVYISICVCRFLTTECTRRFKSQFWN